MRWLLLHHKFIECIHDYSCWCWLLSQCRIVCRPLARHPSQQQQYYYYFGAHDKCHENGAKTGIMKIQILVAVAITFGLEKPKHPTTVHNKSKIRKALKKFLTLLWCDMVLCRMIIIIISSSGCFFFLFFFSVSVERTFDHFFLGFTTKTGFFSFFLDEFICYMKTW